MPCPPRMRGCRAGCLHRAFVQQYHAERWSAEQKRDAETGGYAAELADYPEIITFKQYLIDHEGEHHEAE